MSLLTAPAFALKIAIFPEPAAAMPMEALLLIQLYVLAFPVKMMGSDGWPLQICCVGIGSIVGLGKTLSTKSSGAPEQVSPALMN